MKHKGWLMGAAAIALAAACNKAPAPMTEAERTALADSVDQVVTRWLASLATQPTVDKLLSAYVRGDDLMHAEGGMIYPTYDSLASAVGPFVTRASSMRVTLDQKRFTVLDRDVVVMAAMANGTMRDSAGRESSSRQAWTAVWHRTADGWKIAADHECMAPPAPPAPPKPERTGR